MSGNANIIVVEGRLTRDPSYIKTKNGKSLCKFSIANNRYYYVNGRLALEVKSLDKKTIEKNNYYNNANNQIVSDVIEEGLEQVF